MKRLSFLAVLMLSLALFASAQTPAADSTQPQASPSVSAQPPQASPAPTQPSYANYSIMLVNSTGDGVVLMYNPKGALELVSVKSVKTSMDAGYVPVRAAELNNLIQSLAEANARLTAENAKLQSSQTVATPQAPPAPSYVPTQAEIEAQRKAEERAEKRARQQQLLQNWMMLQNMNRPQPYQLQMPQFPRPVPNNNINCTSTTIGNQTQTNCQ